jgi:hypothetical protein
MALSYPTKRVPTIDILGLSAFLELIDRVFFEVYIFSCFSAGYDLNEN